MSHFYASIRGHRGEATRQGTAKSGMDGHVRGWHVGAQVRCYVNQEGEDTVKVWLTGGSNGFSAQDQLIGTYTRQDVEQGLPDDTPESLLLRAQSLVLEQLYEARDDAQIEGKYDHARAVQLAKADQAVNDALVALEKAR